MKIYLFYLFSFGVKFFIGIYLWGKMRLTILALSTRVYTSWCIKTSHIALIPHIVVNNNIVVVITTVFVVNFVLRIFIGRSQHVCVCGMCACEISNAMLVENACVQEVIASAYLSNFVDHATQFRTMDSDVANILLWMRRSAMGYCKARG